MISKTRRPCIAVVTALLCATTALRRKIAATRSRAACAPDAFILSDACRSVFEQSAGQVASRSK
jgi:hypothetical protein